MNKISYGISIATKIAQKIDNDMNWHLGAIIMKGREVVSIGYNSRKTHPRSLQKWGLLHAEVHAIVAVNKEKLYNSTMFISRAGFENRQVLMTSCPCSQCCQIIKLAKIRKVYYTISNTKIGLWNVYRNTFEELDFSGI